MRALVMNAHVCMGVGVRECVYVGMRVCPLVCVRAWWSACECACVCVCLRSCAHGRVCAHHRGACVYQCMYVDYASNERTHMYMYAQCDADRDWMELEKADTMYTDMCPDIAISRDLYRSANSALWPVEVFSSSCSSHLNGWINWLFIT